MKKQISRTILSAVLLLSLAGRWSPVYGAVEVESESSVVFPKEEGARQVDTELHGAIEVALISAALPSDVEFCINPEGRFSLDTPDGQMENPSPDKFTVTNLSRVPIRLEIASVDEIRPGDVIFHSLKDVKDGPPQSFQLVDKLSGVNDFGTAILVLGEAGKTYHSEADFERHAIYPAYIREKITVTVTGRDGEELSADGLEFWRTDYSGNQTKMFTWGNLEDAEASVKEESITDGERVTDCMTIYGDEILSSEERVYLFSHIRVPASWGNAYAGASIEIQLTAEAIQSDFIEVPENVEHASDRAWNAFLNF